MPRLIDADKLKECFPDDTFKNRMVKVIIDRQLTVEREVKEALEIAIKALEQEPILDKIRAEIESCREDEEPHLCDYRYHRNEGLEMALDIINKYKAESEDKE